MKNVKSGFTLRIFGKKITATWFWGSEWDEAESVIPVNIWRIWFVGAQIPSVYAFCEMLGEGGIVGFYIF